MVGNGNSNNGNRNKYFIAVMNIRLQKINRILARKTYIIELITIIILTYNTLFLMNVAKCNIMQRVKV